MMPDFNGHNRALSEDKVAARFTFCAGWRVLVYVCPYDGGIIG
jgi:hypothetical protein